MAFVSYRKMMLMALFMFAIVLLSAQTGSAIRKFPDGFLLQILQGHITPPGPDPCTTIPGQGGSGHCP